MELLSGYRHTTDGFTCSGYFDSGTKRLVVSTSRDDWALILAHEYGHMQQWKTGLFEQDDGAFEKFENWLQHKDELDGKELTRCIRFIQQCELDAEKRAVGLIRKYKLTEDISLYRQKANAYVLFYEVVRRHRRWSNQESPYRAPDVYKQMPTYFIRNLANITKKFENTVVAKCM